MGLQMYAKRHFLLPPKTVNALNEKVLGLVRCETQATMLKKLCDGAFLTDEERLAVLLISPIHLPANLQEAVFDLQFAALAC